MTLAQLVEQVISFGIFVVALVLAALSQLAYRRERDRRMAIVSGAYVMFSVYGLLVFLEYLLHPFLPYQVVELIEHGAALLILGGLLAFFVALSRE